MLQSTALPVKYFTFKFRSTGLISEIPSTLKTFCKSSNFSQSATLDIPLLCFMVRNAGGGHIFDSLGGKFQLLVMMAESNELKLLVECPPLLQIEGE